MRVDTRAKRDAKFQAPPRTIELLSALLLVVHSHTLPTVSNRPKTLRSNEPTGAVLTFDHWLPHHPQLELSVLTPSPHQ
jgi:hypothetical protein